MNHLKVKVRYYRRCPEWDEKTCPYLVDAKTGETIARIPQFVNHPGEFDQRAENIARMIEASINGSGE